MVITICVQCSANRNHEYYLEKESFLNNFLNLSFPLLFIQKYLIYDFGLEVLRVKISTLSDLKLENPGVSLQ